MARGYNSRRRKVTSYFPISASQADSDHFLRLDSRPGNVHDGAASVAFLRTVFAQVEDSQGRANSLRLRMDSAFLNEHKASYAVKVPFWQGLDLKGQIARQRLMASGSGGHLCLCHHRIRQEMEARFLGDRLQ